MIGQDVGTLERRCARMFSNRIALVWRDERLTYGELHSRVNKCAQALANLAVKKGDRVCILLPNCLEYVELDLALAKLGAIKVPLLARLHSNEWATIIDDSEANTLVFEEGLLPEVLRGRSRIQGLKNLICVTRHQKELPAGVFDFHDLLSKASADEPLTHVFPEDVIALMYTGGTTGKPKGVIHTHNTWVSIALGHLLEDDMDRQCITLHAAGLPHASGFLQLPTLLRGGTNVILEHFDAEEFFATVEKESVTHVFLAPTMVYMLLDHPDLKRYNLTSLRCLLYGGAPMHVERLKEAINAFGPCLMGGYAQMEAANLICRLYPEEHVKTSSDKLMRRLTSCGRPVTMVQLRIVDDQEKDVPPEEPGEIIIRGPHVMKGYWRRERETAAALRNGWLHTGDVARMDENGYVYIVDRKKDMIISGGLNIYSREVEEAVHQHPAVAQAAAIGLPDSKWGERLTAVVLLREGEQATEDEIITFCKERLTDYKCPKSIKFIDRMPLTPAGKIDKKQLRMAFATVMGSSALEL